MVRTSFDLGFVFMQEVSSLGIRVQAAGFILLNPNADQLAREIVPLGEPIKGLPSNVLLHHLPLKLDAVRTLLSGHGFHLSKAQNTCQITNFNLSGSRGALQGAADLGLFSPQQRTSEDCRGTSEKCPILLQKSAVSDGSFGYLAKDDRL
jgi:hypothetical protein